MNSRYRKKDGLESWIFERKLMAHWPEWRKDCTRSLHDFSYTPIRRRYRKPWHPFAYYFYRSGRVLGPPSIPDIMRKRRSSQTGDDLG